MDGKDELCVLHVCTSEPEAKDYAQELNSRLIPKQQIVIQKLESTQNVLRKILEAIGPLPTNSDEFVLAIRKIIKCITDAKTEIN